MALKLGREREAINITVYQKRRRQWVTRYPDIPKKGMKEEASAYDEDFILEGATCFQ